MHDYPKRMTEEERAVASSQFSMLSTKGHGFCPCGEKITLLRSYRCFFCKIWFCAACAGGHFSTKGGNHDGNLQQGNKRGGG